MPTITDVEVVLLNKPQLAYFGILFAGLKKKRLTDQNQKPGCYTNGEVIGFNFTDATPLSELLGMTIHCLLHMISYHYHRLVNRDVDLWNFCCDHVVNREILRIKKNLPKGYITLPGGYVFLKELHGKYPEIAVEELYNMLNKDDDESKLSFDNYLENASPRAVISMGDDVFDYPKDVQIISQTKAEKINSDLEKVHNYSKVLWDSNGFDAGSMPGTLRKYLKKIFVVKVPWGEILNLALKEFSVENEDRSWAIKHSYYPNIKIPGVIREEKPLALIATIDLSGSISDKQSEIFASVIADASFFYDEIIVLTHDSILIDEFYFKDKSRNEIFTYLNAKMKGGGGTSHKGPFTRIDVIYFDDLYKIGSVLFFTDFMSDVYEIYHNYRFIFCLPTIWLVNGYWSTSSNATENFDVVFPKCVTKTIKVDA